MNKLLFSYFLLIGMCSVILSLTSCQPDDLYRPNREKKPANEWVHTTLQKEYLWNSDVPSNRNLDFSLDTEEFFYSLLSNKDGKHTANKNYYYSRIEQNTTTKSGGMITSYGFAPIYFLDERNNNVFVRILYIIPDSPAEKAGLKRGDFITKYGGVTLTLSNYSELDKKTGAMKVTLAEYHNGRLHDTETVHLDAAKKVEDNPFYRDTVYVDGSKKIAYLMYNSFVSGYTDDSNEYTIQMREIFQRFKAKQPDEFILDLRINGGGLVQCAQQLATYLAPQDALNDLFCYLEFNNGRKRNLSFSTEDKTHNLNLKKIHIIITGNSASASELVINGLRPYFGDENIILIGEKSEGKNVGSSKFTDDTDSWIMHPMTCYVYNKNGEKDYENGFTPDFDDISEYEADLEWFDYGNTNEYILKNVLHIIRTGQALSSGRSTKATDEGITTIIPSKRNMLIID